LELTYKPFYEIIRKSKPEIPIVMVSRPDFYRHLKSNLQRRDIIYKAYQDAFNNGDKNIYFVNGETLFGENDRDSCTVDGCHPNDLGSMRIAKVLYEVLHRIL
jgi:lysophospholipase L1-like esterase